MKKWTLLTLAAATALAACNKDDDSDPAPATGSTTAQLSMNITGLEDLGSDYKYEGWIIVDGSPVSTGVFTVDANGNPSETSFSVNKDQLSSATKFVLTIEPSPDSDPAPSDSKLLGGDFSGSDASVSIGDGAALGNDLTAATGKYILATPTTTDMSDELSGVWFLDNSSGSPAAGLDLPTLPAGWAYEGWAVVDGTPVSTGTFTSISGADNAAPFSGSDAGGPPFPGEDLIVNAPSGLSFPTDLSGKVAVISIEPVPDNSPASFYFEASSWYDSFSSYGNDSLQHG